MTYKYRGTQPAGLNGGGGSGATPATRWVLAGSNEEIWYAANSDQTDWTGYEHAGGNSNGFTIGFGKNSSGDGIYIVPMNNTNNEIRVSGTDVTSTATWTSVNLPGAATIQLFAMVWGAASNGATAGVWLAGGKLDTEAKIYRSTDGGANWTGIDISSIVPDTSEAIPTIASDGSGKWAFVQDQYLYYSTDDGQSFARSTPFSSTRLNGIAYNESNSTWVIAYTNSGLKVRSAAASDLTTWSSETAVTGTGGAVQVPASGLGRRTRIAAYNGRIAIVSAIGSSTNTRLGFADVNGTTISNMDSVAITNASDVSKDMFTDGTTWMLVTRGADVWTSTDNAETWTKIVDGISGFGNGALQGVTGDVFLPIGSQVNR